MAGIKIIQVKRFNYQLELPEDFDRPLAVYREGWMYIDSLESYVARQQPVINECYVIAWHKGAHFLKVTGSYSKWWIIRKAEQIFDKLFPIKYKITYYSK